MPYIVAGGIRDSESIRATIRSGADIVQIGTAFENHKVAYKHALEFSKIVKEEGSKKLHR